MGFRALRVLNEHRIEPGHGFGTHSRRDMEIVTCVIDGVLRHEDSLNALQPGLHAWVQVVRGGIQLNGTALSAGDARRSWMRRWSSPAHPQARLC